MPTRPASVVDALLVPRGLFTGSYRLTSRAYQVLLARSGASPSVGLELGALGSALGDLCLARLLGKRQGTTLLPRFASDTLDTFAWSLQTDGPYDASVLTGVPLCLEAGLRYGVLGFLVPLGEATITATLRKRMGRDRGIGAYSWQVLATLGGASVSRYARRWSRAAEASLQEIASAKVREAHHGGQSSLAMGADSLLDELHPTLNLLGTTGPALEIAGRLRSWKAGLVSTSGRAAYLKEVIDAFEQVKNSSSDLRRDVVIHLARDATTKVVTASQQLFIHDALSRMELCGEVSIDLVHEDPSTPPGSALSIGVNGTVVEVPADASVPLPPFDPGPVLSLLGAAWVLGPAAPSGGSVALGACLPVSLACGLLGAYGFLRRLGAKDLLWPAIAILEAASFLLGWSGPRETFSPQGIQRFPANSALVSPALLAGIAYDSLSAKERILLGIAFVSAIATGVALGSRPVRFSHLVVDLAWPYAAFSSARGIGRALARHAQALEAYQESVLDAATKEAFEEGRSVLLELLRRSVFDAWRSLEGSRDKVADDIAYEVERRLGNIEKQLEALR
ncbi:MAG: hypothetical protein M1522_02180 [Actinobacteria bacterium]|nr:hypothetical protein [Actinomycetota bacterium]